MWSPWEREGQYSISAATYLLPFHDGKPCSWIWLHQPCDWVIF